MARYKFAGTEYEIPAARTFAEARTLKRITGMTEAEVSRSILADGTDPDIAFALFVISVQRVRPEVTEQELERVKMDEVELVLDKEDADGNPPPDAGQSAGT